MRSFLVAVASATILTACSSSSSSSTEPSTSAVEIPNAEPTAFRHVAYGPEAEQRLDLVLPGTGADHPLIVWVHGGGFSGGANDEVPWRVAAQVDRGFAVASVGYRLAPEHPFPAGLNDVKRAVRWLKAHSRRYGLDTDRFAAWGHSAGGNLAAMVALTPGDLEPTGLPRRVERSDSAVAAWVDEAGPSDLTTWWNEAGSFSLSSTLAYFACSRIEICSHDAMRLASPLSWVDSSDPPGYLVYGRMDDLVDAELQGLPLYRALVAARGPGAAVWDLVSTGTSTAELHDPGGATDRSAIECFLDRSLGIPAPDC